MVFKALYYIVPVENLVGILREGKIYSRNKAKEKGLIKTDPSDQEVQQRRANKTIYKSYTLHDYVNLYINPRNAMLYRYLKERRKIVVLEISGSILSKFKYVRYSLKNASADDAIISESPDIIKAHINEIFSSSWNGDENIKKIMQSEVLVWGFVPVGFVYRIIVPENYIWEVRKIVEKLGYNIPVASSSYIIEDIFFENDL